MNIYNLLEETEYFFEKITNSDYYNKYERKIGAAGLTSIGGALGSAVAIRTKTPTTTYNFKNKDFSPVVDDSVKRELNTMGIDTDKLLPSDPLVLPRLNSITFGNKWNWTGGHELATMGFLGIAASAFGYQLYKYLHSFLRYSSVVKKLEMKLKADPSNSELKEKLKKFKFKMEEARKRAEIEERSNIEKLKEYEIRLKSMKNDNAPKKDINDLISKIEVKRNALKRAGIILK